MMARKHRLKGFSDIRYKYVWRDVCKALAFAVLLLCCCVSLCRAQQQQPPVRWQGTLRNSAAHPVAGATAQLTSNGNTLTTTTGADGTFSFSAAAAGRYQLTFSIDGRRLAAPCVVDLPPVAGDTTLPLSDGSVLLLTGGISAAGESGGGEQLSSRAVSELPLNKRDFSQLLLLAAGTMTDSNGATNFTAQFAINGQRGVEAVFAMDGADVSDPEMGGATFSNFNVDAVQEIQSSSGVMTAEVGRGAAGYTNIITRSGTRGFHGSVFEFVRNSAFDARNYFDHATPVSPGRIPAFRRNEFGFTNGGPLVLPRHNMRDRLFYFGQYQGFRQILGTTQVLPVPTAEERAGLDTTAFPGDTLFVPVDSAIAPVLARYPLPNLPTGPYGAHTYATSSKVATDADQFSIRIDAKLSDVSQLFARFNFDNLSGPTTNPDQTVLDSSFGVRYIDRQRNAVVTYTRTPTAHLTLESSLSVTRTTPSFPTPNRTDPAIKFNDGLYEPFNAAAGSVMSAFGNLFQARQNVSFIHGAHALRVGAELRFNRDTTYFGTSPNGEYDFGGGTAYAPVAIRSASGQHNFQVGDALPDTLSGLLTGSPFAYTVAVAPAYFSNGAHIGPAAINREAYAFFAQDTWKVSPRFTLDYGLRYELYTPITERAKRTSGFLFVDTPGGRKQEFVVNPQPGYRFNLTGFAPRVALDWLARGKVHIRAGGAITTIPPNIWQDNSLTGATPFVIYPRLTASPGASFRYGFTITPAQLPRVYTPDGRDIFASGNTKEVPANTVMDIDRYERDIAALSPGHQITPLNLAGIDRNFGNGYLQTWTAGLERDFGGVAANVTYVGTAAVHLPRMAYPNAYPGASPEFAPYTKFDNAGNVIGGFGTQTVVVANSHSTYHALQTSLSGTVAHGGPGVQASYTWAKSIDEVSSVIGGFVSGGAGAVAQSIPQDPFNTRSEKAPSTFDVAHSFTLSLAQDLHGESVGFLRPLDRRITAGWELLSISSISSGLPFTIYSGVQQTGAGSNGVDRPDQVAKPKLSTAGGNNRRREDYFGLGADNASFFSIPINVPGGTGPNQGRFGTLGRNTFRGPAFFNYDFALIKDTPFGRRRSGSELVDVQFRSEFFNLFNIVNMGLPANTVKGSGFGQISRTAGNSRQIQFSLKLIY